MAGGGKDGYKANRKKQSKEKDNLAQKTDLDMKYFIFRICSFFFIEKKKLDYKQEGKV